MATHTNIKLLLDGDPFEAHSMGERWNGWLSPQFTFEQVLAVKEWFEAGDQGFITYDEASDTFTIDYNFAEEAIDEVTGTVGSDGVKVYEWISFGWTWTFAE